MEARERDINETDSAADASSRPWIVHQQFPRFSVLLNAPDDERYKRESRDHPVAFFERDGDGAPYSLSVGPLMAAWLIVQELKTYGASRALPGFEIDVGASQADWLALIEDIWGRRTGRTDNADIRGSLWVARHQFASKLKRVTDDEWSIEMQKKSGVCRMHKVRPMHVTEGLAITSELHTPDKATYVIVDPAGTGHLIVDGVHVPVAQGLQIALASMAAIDAIGWSCTPLDMTKEAFWMRLDTLADGEFKRDAFKVQLSQLNAVLRRSGWELRREQRMSGTYGLRQTRHPPAPI